ncbi:MAG: porin [Verrucomicrobiota bacterium]|nr:porin [Verrucomicrobiota bacterium]
MSMTKHLFMLFLLLGLAPLSAETETNSPQILLSPSTAFKEDIDKKWDYNLNMNQTALEYKASDKLKISAISDMNDVTVLSHLEEDVALDKVMQDLTKTRTGIGTSYKISPNMTLDAQADYSVLQNIATPAPKLNFSISSSF